MVVVIKNSKNDGNTPCHNHFTHVLLLEVSASEMPTAVEAPLKISRRINIRLPTI